MLHDSNSMTFRKRQNYGDDKKISGYQGLGDGGMNSWSTEDFQDSEAILYATLMVVTYHYIFGKTNRMYNTKNGP